MDIIRKLVAFILAAVMVLCLAACHPKNEVAVSSGDIEITSAMYSYYLVMADMEAKDKVNSDESIDTTAKGFDYYKQEIDGKSYSDYVKDLALQHCLKAIAYKKLCDEKDIKLSTEDIANAEYTAQYDWYYFGYNYGYQYGYGDFLPLNGVSYNTYAEVTKVNYYGDAYFKSIYDKGGDKEISADDIQKAMDENYIAIYTITETYTDDTANDVKNKLTKYVDRINNGEEFKTIYEEHNKTEDSSSTTSSNTSSTESNTLSSTENTSSDSISSTENTTSETTSSDSDKKEEPKAKDELIVIVGSEETDSSYKFEKFDEIKAMAMDEVKLIDDTENKAIYLVVKKDINSDTYYKEHLLASEILYLIKGDEFTEMVQEYIKSMEYSVSKFAINQFKVKNISYGA